MSPARPERVQPVTDVVAGFGDGTAISDRAVWLTCRRLDALWRQLAAPVVPLPWVEHQGPGYRSAYENREDAYGEQHQAVNGDTDHHRRHSRHGDPDRTPHEWLVHRLRGLRRGRFACLLGPDKPGREVGGYRGPPGRAYQ